MNSGKVCFEETVRILDMIGTPDGFDPYTCTRSKDNFKVVEPSAVLGKRGGSSMEKSHSVRACLMRKTSCSLEVVVAFIEHAEVSVGEGRRGEEARVQKKIRRRCDSASGEVESEEAKRRRMSRSSSCESDDWLYGPCCVGCRPAQQGDQVPECPNVS